MTPFKNYACWDAGETEHFVHREALEGHPAAFLAVHSPIRAFQLVIGRLPEATDDALLAALANTRPHAIAMVEGEPGSGKSHLIQWLQYRWPKSDSDKVVLVPRSDGSLTGALERLRTQLGHSYSEPLEGIGTASQLTEAGHANQFIGNLVTSAQGSNYANDHLPKHAKWLDARDAWRVLNHGALREHWRAPEDIIKVIRGADGNRDQAVAEFTPSHILDLVSIIRESTERSVGSFKAQRFIGDLEKEAPQVRDAVTENLEVARQLEALAGTGPITVTFIEALNARIAEALQGTLGIQRDELQRKFLEVRRLLRGSAKRLVLLLEDVTNLQGVDQQLIEALLPNPNVDANRALCDLVAVIGVTPQYHSQVLEGLGNVQDRISFHVRLTPVEGRGVVGAQSFFLGKSDSRKRFVATYLNAVRLGLEEVQKWEKDGSLKPRPNACHSARCAHRDTCFARFGSVFVPNVGTSTGEAVGLYPLTAHALERFWNRLEDPTHLRSLKTPRGLLLNVVSGVLGNADALTKGLFPSEQIDSTNLRVDGASPDVVERCERLGGEEGVRLRRVIQSWGDLKDGRRKEDETTGERLYSGIPQGVAYAFDLKWPGEVIKEPSFELPPPLDKDTELPPPPPPTPPPPPDSGLPPDWINNIDDLHRWLDGQPLRNTASWESLLFNAISTLEPGPLGAPRGLWEVVMTAENVTLAGAKGRTTQLTFEVERKTSVVRGLTALAWLQHGKNLESKERMRRFAEAAEFQSLLASEAQKHVARCEERLSDDLGGHPADLAVKSLVLVAMLEEKARPGDSPVEAWRSALKANGAPTSGRCRDWAVLTQRLAPERDALTRNAVGLMRVGVGRPGVALEGIVEGGRVLSAVRDVLQTPEKWSPRRMEALKRDAWATALQVADELRKSFDLAVTAEYTNVAQECMKLDAATDGKDTEQFLSAAESVIDGCLKADPELISQPIQQMWRVAKVQLKNGKLGASSPRLRAVDDAIIRFGERDASEEVRAKLELVLSVPKADLILVEQAVTEAALAIMEGYEKVAEWREGKEKVGSGADERKEAVALLEKVSNALEQAHRGGGR